MRTILFLLCILSVTVTANAQIFGTNHWEEGKYCDTANRTYTGLISWNPPKQGNIFGGKGDYITYKENKNANSRRVSTSEIKSFIMATDSFVVSRAPELSRNPILKVVLNNPVKLYYSLSLIRGMTTINNTPGAYPLTNATSYEDNTYYCGTTPDSLTKINRKNFMVTMSSIMADKPNVVANIQNKTFTYTYFEDLIKYYKVR